MKLNTLVFKRQRILGDLYERCAPIEEIPVYLNDTVEEPIGTVEESPGQYSDAFVFKLPVNVCKLFSVGDYNVGVDYDFVDKEKVSSTDQIKLNHIILVEKQKAVPYGRRSGGNQQAIETREKSENKG
jgi:hypothetical protein